MMLKAHVIAELAGGAFGQWRVKAVVLERLAGLGHIGVGFAAREQIDRRPIIGRADRVGKIGAVVARVVPGKRTRIVAFGPHRNREFDQFDGFLGVERHGLAVGLDLLAAPRP